MKRYCAECGDDVLEGLKEPDQALVSEVWERLCIHVWLHHPEFITNDGKILMEEYGKA